MVKEDQSNSRTIIASHLKIENYAFAYWKLHELVYFLKIFYNVLFLSFFMKVFVTFCFHYACTQFALVMQTELFIDS